MPAVQRIFFRVEESCTNRKDSHINGSSALEYRADIDGLRAIAVFMVLFFHTDIPCFAGGFMGVDVFFVISGFLISSIILKDIDKGNFSFINFYERRARRILPPLFVVCIATAIASALFLTPWLQVVFGDSLLAVTFFVSNIFFWLQDSYFAMDVGEGPLLHTWSLAIEEQFYLFYPLFLVITCKYFGKKHLCRIIFFVLLLSFFLGVYSSYNHPRMAFYLLPTRGWELLIGALLAATGSYFKASLNKWLVQLAALLGLVCLFFALVWVYVAPEVKFPGFVAILPTLGAALIVITGSLGVETWVSRFLSLRCLVKIGLISYSLYLWHWPIIVFTKYYFGIEKLPLLNALQIIIVSMILAYLSWKFIENPIRRRNVLTSRKKLLGAVVLSLSFLVLGGGAAHTAISHGKVVFDKATLSRHPRHSECHMSLDISDETLLLISDDNFLCIMGREKDVPDFISWGDSHMDSLMPLFDKIAEEKGLYGLHRTVSAGIPLLGMVQDRPEYSEELKENYLKFTEGMVNLVKQSNTKNLLLHARWSYYTREISFHESFTEEEGLYLFENALEKTIESFDDSGITIWIIKETPEFPADVPNTVKGIAKKNKDASVIPNYTIPISTYFKQTEKVEEIFNRLSHKHPKMRFIDPSALLCADGLECISVSAGKVLYFDDDHLNIYGALFLEPMLQDFFNSISSAN